MRRSGKKKGLTVQLFPFLAVLICTMGALIVLLVGVMQQARAAGAAAAADEQKRATAKALAHQAEEAKKRQALEDNEWRLQVLLQQREEMSGRLAEQRNRLSHLEDHLRRLQVELRTELEDAERLKKSGQESADLVALRGRIDLAHQAAENARQAVADAEKRAAEKPRSFSLVPYVGPNGTQRRPVYVECFADRVVFQPEGVVLREADFTGPLDAGNPFDAGLRTIRDYWAGQGDVAVHGEPYPLIVVRPGGAVSYSAARSAMKSWDNEFGYELVDDSLPLKYPPPDPVLKQRLELTLAQARHRQELLKSARPTLYGDGGPRGFRAAHRGGLVAVEGDNPESGFPREAFTWGGKPKSGASGSEFSESEGTSSEAGTGSQGEAVGALGGGSGADGGQGAYSLGTSSSGSPSGADSSSEGQSQAQGDAGPPQFGAMPNRGKPGSGSAPPPPGSARGQKGASGESKPGSMAASRGENWGLPNASRGAVPYTRPITARCTAERMVLVPPRGSGQSSQAILFDGATRHSVDGLVSALWKRIDSWGLAGPGAYWKPVLKVEVEPGGEDRFHDLQLLLQGSGIEIERKSP